MALLVKYKKKIKKNKIKNFILDLLKINKNNEGIIIAVKVSAKRMDNAICVL